MLKLTKLVLNNPIKVILVLFLVTVVFAFFIPDLSFEGDMESMIPEDDPVIEELDRSVEDFGSQDLMMIVIKDDNIFKAETLAKIDKMAAELEMLSSVEEVTTLLNAELIDSDPMGIKIESLAEKLPQTEQEIKNFKDKIYDSKYLGELISPDGGSTLITIKQKEISEVDLNKHISSMEEVVNQYQGPEEIYLVGNIYTSYVMERDMKEDIKYLLPLVILILIIVLFWSFRSITGVILPLLTVLISVIWSLGLTALLNIPMAMVMIPMPIILIAIGSADGIHILNKYYEELLATDSKRKAIEETMKEMNSPVILTSITTAAGFVALLTSFVTPIKQFGAITAFGVMVAMFFSLLFIPASLSLLKAPTISKDKGKNKVWLSKILNRLSRFIITNDKKILISSLLILLIFIFGSTNLRFESNNLNYFKESSPVIKGTNIVEDNLGGTLKISLVFAGKDKDTFKEPAMLKELVKTQEFLDSLPNVSHATSLADIVRELNQAVNLGEEDYYQIPDSRKLVAQELLLFTMQGGKGLEPVVNYDFSKALVSARINNLPSKELEETIAVIEDYLQQNYSAEQGLQVKVVGTPKVILRLRERFITTQISSMLTSIIVVALLVSLLMRSWLAGLISIIPLILSVGINFGLMGYLNIPLDAVTTMIASISIGIGIDYSIHFLSKYRNEIREGKKRDEALAITSITSGRGIFFNAITLILGFGVLIFSNFRVIQTFGALISLTMLISSMAAIIVVQAILHLLSERVIVKE